jgi:hypothetical protein
MAAASSETEAPAAATAAPVKAPDLKPSDEDGAAGGVAQAAQGRDGKAEKAAGKGATAGGKGAKGKQAKASKGAVAADDGAGPSVAAHPRAARAVARAKSWGGLLGFLVGGYLSLPTATLADAGLRALLAGVLCYVVAWAGAVFLWRRLVVIEIKAREAQLLDAAEIRAARRDGGPGAAGERARARTA